jgi:hypothetical protein
MRFPFLSLMPYPQIPRRNHKKGGGKMRLSILKLLKTHVEKMSPFRRATICMKTTELFQFIHDVDEKIGVTKRDFHRVWSRKRLPVHPRDRKSLPMQTMEAPCLSDRGGSPRRDLLSETGGYKKMARMKVGPGMCMKKRVMMTKYRYVGPPFCT